MKISLIPSVEYIKEDEIRGKTVVIIDVLRATSVITTALSNGALEVIPKLEIEDALDRRKENCLLGGERKALKIQGFDLSNSPLDYAKDKVEGKTIILSTTNGTRAILHSLFADKIVIGSMVNGRAVAQYIHKENKDTVIVCAGTYGKFSLDDFLCAGKIIFDCKEIGDIEVEDLAATAYMAYRDNRTDTLSYISMASHYKYLITIGLLEDIKYCFTEDLFDIVPKVDEVHDEIIIRVY